LEIVLDEWFAEYICSTRERQILVLEILERMRRRSDVLVVEFGSPFFQKLCGLNRMQVCRGLKVFFLILRDSERVRFVYPHEIPPMDIATLEPIPRKDRYLVELMSVTRDKTIITTDWPLYEAVNRLEGYRARLLADFVDEYTKRGEAAGS